MVRSISTAYGKVSLDSLDCKSSKMKYTCASSCRQLSTSAATEGSWHQRVGLFKVSIAMPVLDTLELSLGAMYAVAPCRCARYATNMKLVRQQSGSLFS